MQADASAADSHRSTTLNSRATTVGGVRHRTEPSDDVTSRRAFLHTVGLIVIAGVGGSLLSACASSTSELTQTSSETTPRRSVTLYRQEGCSCCETYAQYLGDNGYDVEVLTEDDLTPIHQRFGIPDDAVGCHTSIVGDYVVEGHVPVEAIDRILTEQPTFKGISVVGMPLNSPGMGEPNGEPLPVLSFTDSRVANFMSITTF